MKLSNPSIEWLRKEGRKIQAHYIPVYQPHPTNPTIIGYNVWAYIGNPLGGEIKGSMQFVKTKYQAQKLAHEFRKGVE